MTTTTGHTISARTLARRRRTDAFRRNWKIFRTNRAGLLGLGLLIFFIMRFRARRAGVDEKMLFTELPPD